MAGGDVGQLALQQSLQVLQGLGRGIGVGGQLGRGIERAGEGPHVVGCAPFRRRCAATASCDVSAAGSWRGLDRPARSVSAGSGARRRKCSRQRWDRCPRRIDRCRGLGLDACRPAPGRSVRCRWSASQGGVRGLCSQALTDQLDPVDQRDAAGRRTPAQWQAPPRASPSRFGCDADGLLSDAPECRRPQSARARYFGELGGASRLRHRLRCQRTLVGRLVATHRVVLSLAAALGTVTVANARRHGTRCRHRGSTCELRSPRRLAHRQSRGEGWSAAPPCCCSRRRRAEATWMPSAIPQLETANAGSRQPAPALQHHRLGTPQPARPSRRRSALAETGDAVDQARPPTLLRYLGCFGHFCGRGFAAGGLSPETAGGAGVGGAAAG